MSSGTVIAIVVVLGLLAAAAMRKHAISRMNPLLDIAITKHNATIQRSFLGMPQITKRVGERALRMTPMTISTSSPDAGEMTCVDFDLPNPAIGEFRIREKSDAARNAMPTTMMGRMTPLALGIPQIDTRFSAVASDAKQAKPILTAPAVIASLVALPRGADIHVRAGKCFVSVNGVPKDADFIDRLFAASERLLESLETQALRP